MDKKRLGNDIILIASLIIVASIVLAILFAQPKPKNKVARVYVQNTLVETIDLSPNEDAHFYIDGTKSKVHILRHNHQVGVLESGCPHKDCINMGFTSDSNRPIICAYNAVSIVISGLTVNDVEI